MNQRVVSVKGNKTLGGMALWAAALLLSAITLFIGFGTQQASAADTAAYAVTDLGTLGGEGGSQGYDVNENGQVVGGSETTTCPTIGDPPPGMPCCTRTARCGT